MSAKALKPKQKSEKFSLPAAAVNASIQSDFSQSYEELQKEHQRITMLYQKMAMLYQKMAMLNQKMTTRIEKLESLLERAALEYEREKGIIDYLKRAIYGRS